MIQKFFRRIADFFFKKKEKQSIPNSVQQSFPIRRVYSDGIFLLAKSIYSKSFTFTDINYMTSSDEDREGMFLDYSSVLNSLDVGVDAKITLYNRRINNAELENKIMLSTDYDDGRDQLRSEYNDMLRAKAISANGQMQQRVITLSIEKKKVEEARTYFNRAEADLSAAFSQLGSQLEPMSLSDRLSMLYDFYRPGAAEEFRFDMKEEMRKGHDCRDAISPDSMELYKDHFVIGERYGRILFLKNYANYLRDSFVTEICDSNLDIMLSLDLERVPTDKAIRKGENILLGIETNITRWQQRQNAASNFSATVPFDLSRQKAEATDFLSDLQNRDQSMFVGSMVIACCADSYEELKTATETLRSVAQKNLCTLGVLNFQQLDGISTCLPFGCKNISIKRTLTTESACAVCMPFKTQEIMHPKGMFMGTNKLSKNLIMLDRDLLLNPQAIYCGVPGSGKSFYMKMIANPLMLRADSKVEVLFADPDGEMTPLVRRHGGEVIELSASSPHHINAMDLSENYGDKDNPIIDKSEFVLSLFEEAIGELTSIQKSIIDRCVSKVYESYADGGPLATLPVLHDVLMAQPEEEAKAVALAAELFTTGSLSTFGHPTNVDTNAKFISFDISGLGSQLKTLGMLTLCDFMMNRVSDNWKKGIQTWIFLDEFHVLFTQRADGTDTYAASFFTSCFRRYRKRNAVLNACTQNVEWLLGSLGARLMLSNCEIVCMFNQSSSDRKELATLLNISEQQMRFVTNQPQGNGLLRVGGALIPFECTIDPATETYKLMTTKPSDMAMN
ncbi:TraE family protein [Eubacteriales bacterium OttesenSCG-928-N14]|nr:TraE family protein [Eubacteriales bacterium OttesenSCG-928-N14]